MSRRRGCVERVKALLAIVTCLWCPPIMTGLIWAVATYFGGGLLCAYLIGIRPSGVLVYSRSDLWGRKPPEDVPLYVELGNHKGLIYYAQLGDLGVEANQEG